MGKSNSLVEKFFEFENDPNLLKYRFKESGIMMYPYIRVPLYSKTQLLKSNIKNLNLSGISRRKANQLTVKEILQYIGYILKNNCFLIKKKQILFVSNSVLCVKGEESLYYNWLHEPFFNLTRENSSIMERQVGYRILKDRENKEVKATDLLLIISKIVAKFKKCRDLEGIDEFLEYVYKNFPEEIAEETKDWMKKELVFRSKVIKIHQYLWGKIFNKNNLKLLIMHVGFYGGESHIIKLAKERGICVVDIQHALILPEDVTYNYADNLINTSEYNSYLPDFLLTFGDMWEKNISSNVKTKKIGYPILDRTLVKMRQSPERDRKKILFCGNEIYYSRILEIIKQGIKDKCFYANYQLAYRPHPSENIASYREFFDNNNIQIDSGCQISDAIINSDIIVTLPSTVAYEALLYKKACFVLDIDNVLKDAVGEKIVSFDELSQALDKLDDKNVYDLENSDGYYDLNWRKGYLSFLKLIGIDIDKGGI